VVKLKKALTEPMLITTTWSGPSDNNTIYAYDADGNEGDLIVNKSALTRAPTSSTFMTAIT